MNKKNAKTVQNIYCKFTTNVKNVRMMQKLEKDRCVGEGGLFGLRRACAVCVDKVSKYIQIGERGGSYGSIANLILNTSLRKEGIMKLRWTRIEFCTRHWPHCLLLANAVTRA